jgi:hypothetical protein
LATEVARNITVLGKKKKQGKLLSDIIEICTVEKRGKYLYQIIDNIYIC